MIWRAPVLAAVLIILVGCDQGMENQPRYEALEAAPPWENNQSARSPVPGTVARDADIGEIPHSLPRPLTRELLEEGRHQYEVFCTPCHGPVGNGRGMVVQRGFPQPPSFHSDRLRQVPIRHFYDVISNGFGVMYSYAARVSPEERWAIAAYIRALQLSRHGSPDDLLPQQREALMGRGAEDVSGGGQP